MGIQGVLRNLKSGPKTRKELASIEGVTHDEIGSSLSALIKSGRVVRIDDAPRSGPRLGIIATYALSQGVR